MAVCCRNNLCLPERCFSRCSAARGIPTICPVVTQVANSALPQTCDLPLKGTFQRAKVGFPTVLEVAHREKFSGSDVYEEIGLGNRLLKYKFFLRHKPPSLSLVIVIWFFQRNKLLLNDKDYLFCNHYLIDKCYHI